MLTFVSGLIVTFLSLQPLASEQQALDEFFMALLTHRSRLANRTAAGGLRQTGVPALAADHGLANCRSRIRLRG